MGADEAYSIEVEDAGMRAYLQRYPFAEGPDEAMNGRCRAAVLAGFRARPAGEAVEVTRLGECGLGEDALRRVRGLMAAAGVAEVRWAGLVDDFAWEAALVPPDRQDVLVIGCGDGIELLFLRAVLPAARLCAIDYGDKMPAAMKAAIGVRFMAGDMAELLAGVEAAGERFDCVSSNHTLEHLYAPDATLRMLARLLRPGGAMVATMPMDAAAGSPFAEEVAKFAEAGVRHPLDFTFVDAGHPWKTNAGDLAGTLRRAGFGEVALFQRGEHLSRYVAAAEGEFRAQRARGLVLNRRWFGPLRAGVKRVWPRGAPATVTKGLLAAERRTWFGTNRLKNTYTEEVCVVARVPLEGGKPVEGF